MSPITFHPWACATSAGFTLRGWHTPVTGRPVLHFIHGNGFCSRSYEPMLTQLSAHFDLWLVDTQGHGESDQGSHCLDWQSNANMVMETLQHMAELFGHVPKFAVGHSFGGVLTSYLLAARPTLFARSVLLDPVLFSPAMLAVMALSTWWRGIPSNDLAKRALRRRHVWTSRDAAHQDFSGRGIFRGWTDDALRAHVTHATRECDAGITLRCAPAQEAAIFSSYPKNLWPTLKTVRTPSLVLHGVTSYPFVGRSARRWRQHNSSVIAEQVAGGHCFMQEHPDATAKRISDFLLD